MVGMRPGEHIPRRWLRWLGSPGTIDMPGGTRLKLWFYVDHWKGGCQTCWERLAGLVEVRMRPRPLRRGARCRRRRLSLQVWRRGRLGRVSGRARCWRRQGRLRRVERDPLSLSDA